MAAFSQYVRFRYEAVRGRACGRGVFFRQRPMLDVSHGSWPGKGEWARPVGDWPEIDRRGAGADTQKPNLPNGYPHDADLPELGLLSGRDVGGCKRQAARWPRFARFRSWPRG